MIPKWLGWDDSNSLLSQEVAILAPDQDHQRRWHLKFRIPGFWHVVWVPLAA